MKNSVIISDLETLLEMFLCVCYDPQEDKWHRFEVSRRKNQLDGLINYVESHEDYYFVYYNGLRFDSQVLEFIIRNHQNWIDKTNLEICAIISQLATDVIDDSNYDVFPRYRENQLSFKIIDPFELMGFSNKNRMVSLKRIEFELDLENIEEMPIHHLKKDLTEKECQLTADYCINDVKALYELYKVVIGDTEHPLYKGNNQVELRQNIEEEFEIPCLNYSDTKIGDEIIKKYYCQEKRINYSDLPKKGFFRKEIKASNCIAKYVKFQTKELQDFLKNLKRQTFGMKDDFKKTIVFRGNKYSFMQGGLHTEQSPEIFTSTEDKLIIDYDVSSYYPAIIINNNQYPFHLGKSFLTGYEKTFRKRIELKPLAKGDKKIEGSVGALKLCVNGVYGKTSDMQNWMYDKQVTLFTCITGELSLMMLIEAYELAGIHVISANTDGITSFTDISNLPKIEEINNWWMELTGYSLERTDYKKIIFSSVNDYIAIKEDGSIKLKGDYVIDFELYKNKSGRIIPIAIKEYFVNGIPIETTIKNHTNIYDFCIRQKSSRNFHYEGIIKSTGKTTIYNKLIRYYVSNEGEKIYKIKNPSCQTNAPEKSQVEAGSWVCYICNKLEKDHPTTNVDFNYYIERANRIINKVEGKKPPAKVISNQLQLSLE